MKYDLTFLELELRELLKKLKKHNTYAMQLEDEIRLYALENAKLKEKNEELRALYDSEREVKEDYKSRNNKAIEYIENTDDFDIEIFDYASGGCLGTDLSKGAKKVLNILQGDDKE